MIQKGDIRVQFANMIIMFLIISDLILLLFIFLLFGPFGLLRLIGDLDSITPLPEIALILLIPLIALKLVLHTDDRQLLLEENKKVLIKSPISFLSKKINMDDIIEIKKMYDTELYCVQTENEVFRVSIPIDDLEIIKIKTVPNKIKKQKGF